MNDKIAIIEGILFIVGDDGITIDEISEILNIEPSKTLDLLEELKVNYDNNDMSGLTIGILGSKYKLTTKVIHNDYYKKIFETTSSNVLSQAALETLIILAYNGPITRLEVDEIRGISSSQMIRKLISRNLVIIVGKANLPGKPNLYKVTEEFFDCFGLKSIEDLPKKNLKKAPIESDEVDLFKSKYSELSKVE